MEETADQAQHSLDVLKLFYRDRISPAAEKERDPWIFFDDAATPCDLSFAHQDALAYLASSTTRTPRRGNTKPSNWNHGLDAMVQVFAASTLIRTLASRIAILEGQVSQLSGTRTPAKSVAAISLHKMQSELEHKLPKISEVFASSFGVEKVHSEITPSESEEYNFRILLRALDPNADAILTARVNGGRKTFYESVLDVLPEDLFDRTEFELEFEDAAD